MNIKLMKSTTLPRLFAATFICMLFFNACENNSEPAVIKYPYEQVEGDKLDARIYTLENGLKVYLTVNNNAPRVQTFIAVRAGSKSDPSETTGLAHYLEHMLFKGTHQFGTLNWEKEKTMLESIASLYEKHKETGDSLTKRAIYKQIDSLSYEASKLSVPNEYDKMIGSMGAKGTNAYTWVEQTVYVNDIPANELEKWLMLESERFQTLVLRLFHTELEAVYEEFNRAQDSDFRKSWKALFEGLFPNHPYGTQTTLGEGEHLKNPSMVNIHNYFDTYYVPNNVAICLSGDLDPDKTIELIDQYFGSWQPKQVPEFNFGEQPAYTEPLVKEAFGVQPEHLYMGYRFDGATSEEATMITLINQILFNEQAGLIDLDLVQKQKVLSANAFDLLMADYSAHIFYGEPREGQTLEEVKDLLLAEVEKVKKGDFDDWMISAAIKNLKLSQIKAYEGNRARADKFVDAFIWGMDWATMTHEFDKLESITKEDIVNFANAHYADNYVVVYKRIGETPDAHKVDKPAITPVVMNRDTQSLFVAKMDSIETPRLSPVFVDYKNEIDTRPLSSGIEFNYLNNERNELFELAYIFDMGRNNSRELSLAIKYLPYLGTDQYPADQLQKEFFKLGLNFDVFASAEKVYVTLTGLDESFEEGLKLFEHILSSVQPDETALKDLVAGILKERMDAKRNKGIILRSALVSYGKYGPQSTFTNILSTEELNALAPEQLVDDIKGLTSYKHRIFYYGTNEPETIANLLDTYHKVPESLKEYPVAKTFPELETTNKVYFVNYDMVQAEMIFLSKGNTYNKEMLPDLKLFNEYFGAGMSSIVFQEIRESKALAYSAFAYMSSPDKKDKSHYVVAYIGTQADKLEDASKAMLELMNDMPEVPRQYKAAQEAAMKKIESERITGARVFWKYEAAKKLGLQNDVRKDIYKALPQLSISDLSGFFNQHIKDRKYTVLVLGKRENVDMEVLKTFGEVEELSLETIFNY